MPKNRNAEKENASSKNIHIPPIRKQTAGAVAGAAAGSIAGPIGAVVGGVVGAIAGKAAEKRPIAPATTRSARSLMKSPKPPRKKSVAKQPKTHARSGRKAKRLVSHRPTTTSGKGSGSRRRSQSSRGARRRSRGRTKQH